MSKLIFLGDEFAGEKFEVPDGETPVGRAPNNMLIIDHPDISAEHCRILQYAREVIVRDTGSRNGTWVDGVRVQGQTGVKHGQVIRFATVEARLEIPPPPRETRDTSVTAIYDHAKLSRQKPAPAPAPVTIKPRVIRRSSS